MAWRDVFSGVCDAIERGNHIDDGAFETLKDACNLMTSDEARSVYEDLCKIQIAHESRSTQVILGILSSFINTKHLELIDKFHSSLISNGKLCERVADCIELPMEKRLHKWQTQKLHMDSMVKQHRIDSEYIRTWSTYLYESREQNYQAYENVRKRLENTSANEEWQQVICEEDTDLAHRDKTFWYAVQTNRLQIEEKKAVLHRLTELKHNAGDILHRRINELYLEIFYDMHNKYRPTSPVHTRKFCISLSYIRQRMSKLYSRSRRSHGERPRKEPPVVLIHT